VKTRAGIDNHLAAHRQKRGFSAAELAERTGISRQTIYAMEAGSYVPNTVVALRLARILEVSVEDLFSLGGDAPADSRRTGQATLLPCQDSPRAGEPVQLCRVDRRLVASAPSPLPWYLPTADAVVMSAGRFGKAAIQFFPGEYDLGNRILVAGCDPGISVLARHVQRAGVELVVAQRNSSQALALLKQGSVHVAGTHLRDEATGESNLSAIGHVFARKSVAVITLAVWEEGIVVAPGNPKSIRSVADFARQDVAMVNRESGAGSRMLLDTQLQRLGILGKQVRGYDRMAGGHLQAAWQVRSGEADGCIATRAAARIFGLDFIPLVSERYDLAIRRQHLDHPPVQALLDTLNRAGFRRELEGLGGYDTSSAGRRLL
jgi:molybdate-binding protein/DNA-binding XRE family transcriptional regulator